MHRRRFLIFLGAALFAYLGVAFMVAILRPIPVDTTRDRYVKAWLAEQHAALQSGKQSHLYFYDSTGTDAMLREFANEAAIRKLTFELTDLSYDGVQVIAGLPNLEGLTLYGGARPVDDRSLELLRGNETLSTLKLVNTNVTDEGLAVLQTLPNLKHLTLYREGIREKRLTDRAVMELQKLTGLSSLNVPGGWLSPAGIAALRTSLPNCQVIEDENFPLSP